MLVESQTHRPAGLDHPALDRFIPGLIEPPLPGRPEHEPEVVDVCVVLAIFDEQRIVLGSLARLLLAAASGEDPHHPAEEPFAPVRPGLAAVLPLPILCV